MYLTNYPWTLALTNKEFRVIRKLLRGDELFAHEEAVADKMSSTLDAVYTKKMEQRQAAQEQRAMEASPEAKEDDEK